LLNKGLKMAPRRAKNDNDTFADRLNQLFERARARGEPLTNEDVEQRTGGLVTANHVWRMRSGRSQNPGLETLQALAGVFGVGLDYFAGREDGNDTAIRRALAQPEWRDLVTRLGTTQVSPRDAARLANIVEAFLAEYPEEEPST
jgi:transcriptional regulator with XRE-family HTH domain